MKFAKINEVNQLYDKLKDVDPKDFFTEFLGIQNVKYLVFEEDLAKIPKTGPFIVIANHPLGALDGILKGKIFSEIRPDFKSLSNFLLSKIKPMEPYIIPVNPFEGRKEAFGNTYGMRAALAHLQNGGCLGLFPAGQVSNKNNEFGEILDKDWENSAIKLIRKAKVPVIPMYFHTSNSKLVLSSSQDTPRFANGDVARRNDEKKGSSYQNKDWESHFTYCFRRL